MIEMIEPHPRGLDAENIVVASADANPALDLSEPVTSGFAMIDGVLHDRRPSRPGFDA